VTQRDLETELRSIFRAWRGQNGAEDLGGFLDFVVHAVEPPRTHAELAELYERKARERRMMFKPSAAAAKGWETRRSNRKGRDTPKG
jgi:hypothetical protein